MKLAASVKALPVWGTGLVVMLADNDAGNVVTAAQAGAVWGYRLLPLLLILIPFLYMVQELTVRLGIFTGRGYAELIRERLGRVWACGVALALTAATVGTLITEFTAIAGIGELYGLRRPVTLALSVSALLAIAGSGSYRRTEKAALILGAFQLVFFALAWEARPDPSMVLRHAIDMPLRAPSFQYLAAALMGATFNPWMIFYQQSALVEKGLSAADYPVERRDTAWGAVLSQLLTAAVLLAIAAAYSYGNRTGALHGIDDIAGALHALLGGSLPRGLFCIGVLGGAMLAAIVSSLALAWGIGEAAGFRRSLEYRPFEAHWFYALYAAALIGSACIVWRAPGLVSLNIAMQIINALLLPLLTSLLIVLTVTVLSADQRPRAWYRAVLIVSRPSLTSGGDRLERGA